MSEPVAEIVRLLIENLFELVLVPVVVMILNVVLPAFKSFIQQKVDEIEERIAAIRAQTNESVLAIIDSVVGIAVRETEKLYENSKKNGLLMDSREKFENAKQRTQDILRAQYGIDINLDLLESAIEAKVKEYDIFDFLDQYPPSQSER